MFGDLGLSANFKLPGFQNIQVSTNRMRNQLQYPLLEIVDTVQVVRQETNLNVTQDLSVSAVSAPIPRMTLNASANYRNNDINREIDLQQSQQAIDHGANARLTYQFVDSTRVEMRGDWTVGRNLYDDPNRSNLNGDAVTRSVGGIMRRPLGRRATFDASTNYQLQQFFFDIRDDETVTDERDLVRGDLSARVDYFPGKRVRTNLRFNFQHSQTIFLDAARSSFNQTQQLYSIYPSLEYVITPRVTLREDGSIIANATVSEFNENPIVSHAPPTCERASKPRSSRVCCSAFAMAFASSRTAPIRRRRTGSGALQSPMKTSRATCTSMQTTSRSRGLRYTSTPTCGTATSSSCKCKEAGSSRSNPRPSSTRSRSARRSTGP